MYQNIYFLFELEAVEAPEVTLPRFLAYNRIFPQTQYFLIMFAFLSRYELVLQILFMFCATQITLSMSKVDKRANFSTFFDFEPL